MAKDKQQRASLMVTFFHKTTFQVVLTRPLIWQDYFKWPLAMVQAITSGISATHATGNFNVRIILDEGKQ